MNHASGAGSIVRLVGQQSSSLSLYGRPDREMNRTRRKRETNERLPQMPHILSIIAGPHSINHCCLRPIQMYWATEIGKVYLSPEESQEQKRGKKIVMVTCEQWRKHMWYQQVDKFLSVRCEVITWMCIAFSIVCDLESPTKQPWNLNWNFFKYGSSGSENFLIVVILFE